MTRQTPSILVLLALLLAPGCGRTPVAPAALPIYFTCDVDGRLEPCGCFQGQFGGLTRLKTVLDFVPGAGQALRFDVGNAIAGPQDFQRIQYDYLLRAFGLMKFDALNVGRREAELSLAQLNELKRKSPVPIISANLLDQKTGPKILNINCWNEWTEGSYIEPNTVVARIIPNP